MGDFETRGQNDSLHVKGRPNALPSPQKINYWDNGTTKSRCLFCGLLEASTRHIQYMCDKRGTNSLVTKRHDGVGWLCGDAAKCEHHNKTVKINENKAIQIACQQMSRAPQRFKRPDIVYESMNPQTGKSKWELVEITYSWPGSDFDCETLAKAYRQKVSKYDVLQHEAKKEYPNKEVEQATIVVGATCVFHKRSQVEFAKATRSQNNDLARWKRNMVDRPFMVRIGSFVRAWRRRNATSSSIRQRKSLHGSRNIRSILSQMQTTV
jgi:hypothetical protein